MNFSSSSSCRNKIAGVEVSFPIEFVEVSKKITPLNGNHIIMSFLLSFR